LKAKVPNLFYKIIAIVRIKKDKNLFVDKMPNRPKSSKKFSCGCKYIGNATKILKLINKALVKGKQRK